MTDDQILQIASACSGYSVEVLKKTNSDAIKFARVLEQAFKCEFQQVQAEEQKRFDQWIYNLER